jgi:2-methylcitrate dehydratase PrpD
LFAPFGVTCLASYLLGLDAERTTNALGIVGSYAAGLLQCWVDGTQSKFLHPGAAAQSGLIAAAQGRSGVTGPKEVIEGRSGLFASHLQDSAQELRYAELVSDLGERWESEAASFKPYPAAHVIHPYIDALLRLKKKHGLEPDDIARIVCPVPEYIVGIVCEPTAEKRRPQSDSHGRVSLQYTLAEALVLGRLNKDAYAPASRADESILAVADRIEYRVDPGLPGPEQFKGVVIMELRDGKCFTEVEEFNRGSPQNPMSAEEIVGKFDENASDMLDAAQRRALTEKVLKLPEQALAGEIVDLTLGRT